MKAGLFPGTLGCALLSLPVEGGQVLQAGTFGVEEWGCPVNPAQPGMAWTSWKGFEPVNVVHWGHTGLFVHVQISLSRADVSQRHLSSWLTLVAGGARADRWVPNWDSFPGRNRPCVWRGCLYRGLLSKNVPENGKWVKEERGALTFFWTLGKIQSEVFWVEEDTKQRLGSQVSDSTSWRIKSREDLGLILSYAPSSFLYIRLVSRYPAVGGLCMACIHGLHDGVTVFSCWWENRHVQALCECSGFCPCLQSTYCICEAVQRDTASSWSGLIMSTGVLHLPKSQFSDQEWKEMAWSELGDSWSLHGTCPVCHTDGFSVSEWVYEVPGWLSFCGCCALFSLLSSGRPLPFKVINIKIE